MIRTVIRSVGKFLPDKLVTNDDLAKMFNTSDEWIVQRTGIKTRYWVDGEKEVGTSDLGLEASKIALKRAGWDAKDLDLIIFATLSPDIFFPGAGCLLQYKLGLDRTPALDIRQQCTGFIYGLTVADAFIKSSYAKKILFVGAEVHSTGLDLTDEGRDVAVIFGDGAGALCLEQVETDENIGLLSSIYYTQGERYKDLYTKAPASKCSPRITHKMLDEKKHMPIMNGQSVFKKALRCLPEVSLEAIKKAGLQTEDIDLFIPHQANLRINQAYQKYMGVADDKFFNNIDKYGNTTAASIPIALEEAIEQKLIGQKNSTVLFSALGSGLTWGAIVYRF